MSVPHCSRPATLLGSLDGLPEGFRAAAACYRTVPGHTAHWAGSDVSDVTFLMLTHPARDCAQGGSSGGAAAMGQKLLDASSLWVILSSDPAVGFNVQLCVLDDSTPDQNPCLLAALCWWCWQPPSLSSLIADHPHMFLLCAAAEDCLAPLSTAATWPALPDGRTRRCRCDETAAI